MLGYKIVKLVISLVFLILRDYLVLSKGIMFMVLRIKVYDVRGKVGVDLRR